MPRTKKYKGPPIGTGAKPPPAPEMLPDLVVDVALRDRMRAIYSERGHEFLRETFSSPAAIQLLADGLDLDEQFCDRVCSESAAQCVRDFMAAKRAMRAFGRLEREVDEPPTPEERQV